jgi:hypothetical protein
MNVPKAVKILLVEQNTQDLELAFRALREANLSNRIDPTRDAVSVSEE